jgi:sugar-phosphatase
MKPSGSEKHVFSSTAVLLDMDGTLVDSSAVVEHCWSIWAAKHDLDLQQVLSVVHGRQGWASMALLLPERSESENLRDDAALLELEGSIVDPISAIPGAPELLSKLEPLPHALVTSADVKLMRTRMHAAKLRIPDTCVTADDPVKSKPSPEGFLLAAEKLGVAPADCLVFEDSGAGIEAAKRAGMRVIGVGALSRKSNPDFAVADLEAVSVSCVNGTIQTVCSPFTEPDSPPAY